MSAEVAVSASFPKTIESVEQELKLEVARSLALGEIIREAREACGHFQEMADANAQLGAAVTFIEAILTKAED